jgi:hypothetical protein
MPPTKTRLRREFDTALAAYLEAIQDKKTTLFAVTTQPSKGANKNYDKACLKEKEARRAYRKATKRLHALIRNG